MDIQRVKVDIQKSEGDIDYDETRNELKELIKDLQNDMPVFVACQGYCNYDFIKQKPLEDTDTFAIVCDGKLIISDPYAVEGMEE